MTDEAFFVRVAHVNWRGSKDKRGTGGSEAHPRVDDVVSLGPGKKRRSSHANATGLQRVGSFGPSDHGAPRSGGMGMALLDPFSEVVEVPIKSRNATSDELLEMATENLRCIDWDEAVFEKVSVLTLCEKMDYEETKQITSPALSAPVRSLYSQGRYLETIETKTWGISTASRVPPSQGNKLTIFCLIAGTTTKKLNCAR